MWCVFYYCAFEMAGSLLYYCIAYVVQLYCEVSVAKCIVWYLSHSRIVLYVIISVKLYCVIISIQLYCEVADDLIWLCVLYSFINIWCFCTVMLWVIVVQLFWMERPIVLNDVCCTVLECNVCFTIKLYGGVLLYYAMFYTIVLIVVSCTIIIVLCDVFRTQCTLWWLLYSCTVLYMYLLYISLYCYLLPALFQNHTVNNTFYTNGLRILDDGYITNLPGSKLPIKIDQGKFDIRK